MNAHPVDGMDFCFKVMLVVVYPGTQLVELADVCPGDAPGESHVYVVAVEVCRRRCTGRMFSGTLIGAGAAIGSDR